MNPGGNEAAAERNVVREHMFDSTVGIFDVLTYNSNIDRDPGIGEYSIYTMKGLEHALVGVGIPGFAGSNVHTFYLFL